MKRIAEAGYNERLFSGGIRGYVHFARFRWLRDCLQRLTCPQREILELGCFDARTLEWLPRKACRYVGLDANWEGGLDMGRERWGGTPWCELQFCNSLEDLPSEYQFDISISMETLEHLPPEDLPNYLARLAQLTRYYLLITVPNEKGLVFLGRWLSKRLGGGDRHSYTVREFLMALGGHCGAIARDDHKGFDYAALIRQAKEHFSIEKVSSIPYSWAPLWMAFNVGIVAKVKR